MAYTRIDNLPTFLACDDKMGSDAHDPSVSPSNGTYVTMSLQRLPKRGKVETSSENDSRTEE